MHPRKLEFIELFEKSGWNQAETARELDMTRGGLNGIITGPTVPSAALLKFFKMVLAASGRVSILSDSPSANPWSSDLVNELRGLPEHQRDKLITAFRQIAKVIPAQTVSYKQKSAALLHNAIDAATGGDESAAGRATARTQDRQARQGKIGPHGHKVA